MATTAIIAEILIVGLQALTWVSLSLLALLGSERLNFERLERWPALTTIGAVAAAYVLGVLVDRFSDSLFDELGRKRAREHLHRKKKAHGKDKDKVGKRRTEVMVKAGGASEFLEYQRSRLRIARSTVLNLLLAIPATGAFLISRSEGSTPDRILWFALTAVCLLVGAGLSFAAYTRIYAAYLKRLKQIHSMVTRTSTD